MGTLTQTLVGTPGTPAAGASVLYPKTGVVGWYMKDAAGLEHRILDSSGDPTAYAVLCGGTTAAGPVQSIAGVGTSGQVLTSNGASNLPTFQTGTGGASAATQAEQESASSTTVYVSPGRQQFHPSAPKVWASVNATLSAVVSSYNLTSITDGGTGSVTYTYATDFSSSANTPLGTVYDGSGKHTQCTSVGSGDSQWQIFNVPGGTPTLADPSIGHGIAVFGDQA